MVTPIAKGCARHLGPHDLPHGTLRAGIARRCLALVALAAVLGVGCAHTSKKDKSDAGGSSADKHYDVAVGSFHQGMFEDAKLQLDKALRDDPEHADSYYLRGVVLLNEGKSIVDSIEIDQCLVDEAADHQRVRAEGLHRAARKSFAQAAEYYDEGAAGRGRALNSVAVVSLFFHEHDTALEASQTALEQQFYTDRYSALSNRGWAHYLMGDLVSATAELRQAVLLNPEYCVGQYRLAQVYLEMDQPAAAAEHADAVLGNDRCPIQDAYRIAGVARLRLGQDEEAARALDGCVNLAPRSCLAQDCQTLLGGQTPADPTLAHVSTP
jgi:tetratricopeptide (TPR) repeat protein